MKRALKVSVIIPTHNRKAGLLRNLAHLPSDLEIIVVDDGSTDGTAEAVEQIRLTNLTYIKQANSGPSAARNKGIGASSGEFIAFIDDDCIPVSPWPWPLIHRLGQENLRVAGAGGTVRPLRNGFFSRYYTFHRILEPPDSCAYLVTANCAYRRKVLEEVGGFDPRIKQPGGKDPALSMKIRMHGYELAFEPSATVIHDYRENLADFIKTFYRYGRGNAYVMG
jgi:glycosyltransferase involved in cell wall biosynthesis